MRSGSLHSHDTETLGDEFAPAEVRCRLFGVQLHCSALDKAAAFALATRHQYYELVYIQAGEGSHYIGSQFARVQAGDAFLLAPGVYHLHPDSSRYVLWVLRFRSSAADIIDSYESASSRPIRRSYISECERARWESRLRYLRDELKAASCDVGIISTVLRAILLDLERNGSSAVNAHFGRRQMLEAVFRYIDAHYRRAPRLAHIAAAVNFSPAYLTDLVRRETGRPIHQWINIRRVQAAQSLLAESDLSIGAIAEEVGFRDPTYFGRYFAKITGQTPRSWRDAHTSHPPRQWASSLASYHDGTTITPDYYLRLQTLARQCSAAKVRDEIEDLTADATGQIFGGSLTQILRRNGHDGTFIISRQRGLIPQYEARRKGENREVLPLILTGETIAASDFSSSHLTLFKRFQCAGFRSLMIAPIWSQNECIGAIRILERECRVFAERERRLLAMIGAIAGLALTGDVSASLERRPNHEAVTDGKTSFAPRLGGP